MNNSLAESEHPLPGPDPGPDPSEPVDGLSSEEAPADFDVSMMDAALLQDPPEIMAGGGIAPINEWPGRRVDESDVLQAAQNGYGRDWFRFWHRLLRFREVWGEGGAFDRVRRSMTAEDYFKSFHWNQRLLFGAYGNGKSTKWCSHALHYGQKGIPAFHNGPLLGGWLVEGDEIFTLMQEMPKCSLLGHDEAHGTAPGRLSASTAVSTLRGLGANIRKLNVDWTLIGAQWKDVHPLILEECYEALEMELVQVELRGPVSDIEPWDDPRNFQLHWRGWEDYPYKRMRERQKLRKRGYDGDDDDSEDGFGHPDWEGSMDVEEARWAFALTDSFRLTRLDAITSKSERIKSNLRRTRDQSLSNGHDPYRAAVLEFVASELKALEDNEGKDIRMWVTGGDIQKKSGLEARELGRAISAMGVHRQPNRGYPLDELLKAYEEYTS